MFSEYASRFLAQSQSRISFRQEDQNRSPGDRHRRQNPGNSRYQNSKSYLNRPSLGNPYHGAASQISRFPFASRTSTAAPLFYSATDEFREEDDEEEHEREVADFYALQKSRRQFGGSRLEESSEAEDEGSRGSGELDESAEGDSRNFDGRGRGMGIRSSWRGGKLSVRGRTKNTEPLHPAILETHDSNKSDGDSSKGKERLVDVELESAARSSEDLLERDEPPDDLVVDIPPDDHPPPFQQFRKQPQESKPSFDMNSGFIPHETEREALLENPPPPSSDGDSALAHVTFPGSEPPHHDAFWGNLYIISLISVFASFFLVWLHTSAPGKKNPLGDTIYSTLHQSFFLLAIDTFVAILVSLLWLALLRSYVRPLVYLILVAVPVILFSFFLYSFISSFKGSWKGASLQDKAMRWFSIVPFILTLLWTYSVYRGRRSLGKAIEILEFACRILAANPALILLGFATIGGVVGWTWLWMGMFTRVFLGGHLSNSEKPSFIINAGTWWLGAFFILVYLWTLGVGSGIQRATTAATVSQWYFHRTAVTTPSSRQVVHAALHHSTSTLFGTICLSSLLALLIRLPLLILPRRLVSIISLITYSIIPTPIVALTNPLTLTYASIHSQPLAMAARSLSELAFLPVTSPTTALHPRTFARRSDARNLLSYRLAKLLLVATRFIMSLALGFGGWISTARLLEIAPGYRGSLYAYIVGLIAGAIGWGILGAMEGILGGIVDSVIVCWGSEMQTSGGGEAIYCREAGVLFGRGEHMRV
ncbi:MAG: hypothetical protein M1834_005818 [Cirrosporium novae-zelandiae]|nr:MAG: hypothetical protein M1834_005818 [Cirrosporium novae-zelandiae]